MIVEEPISLPEFFGFPPDPSCGAVASFAGVVRDHHHGRRVQKLHYECYRSMALGEMERITAEAKERWNVHEARVIHRVGELQVGETAVAIAVVSAHRAEAFAACRYLIEEIKRRVPIWKKEIFEDGTGEWVVC
ncbi:MAG: molybdenum cofactor biosynthesis protein MoaE [Candidatus Omnitrophica bacterium]|nr:molybdenum cofactor biosynthesis protein MoaE [Candidatus Omnitrophota bacterium]